MIILDQQMPVMGGDETCAHIKEYVRNKRIGNAMLILSSAEEPNEAVASKSGWDYMLQKPLTVSKLHSATSKLL